MEMFVKLSPDDVKMGKEVSKETKTFDVYVQLSDGRISGPQGQLSRIPQHNNGTVNFNRKKFQGMVSSNGGNYVVISHEDLPAMFKKSAK